MTTPQKRSTDAEAVAALIWLAFVVPEDAIPLEDDGKAYLSFHRALELYADTRDRERAAHEADLRSIEADRQQLLQELEAEAARPPVPDPDTAPEAQPPDTHTHTQAGAAAPKSPGGAETPAHFAGKGGGEKQKTYARLMDYCAAHGLGAARKIAAASNGALTDDEVRMMRDAKKLPLQKWRILSAALDWLEENE